MQRLPEHVASRALDGGPLAAMGARGASDRLAGARARGRAATTSWWQEGCCGVAAGLQRL
jgi:hypothetical protein